VLRLRFGVPAGFYQFMEAVAGFGFWRSGYASEFSAASVYITQFIGIGLDGPTITVRAYGLNGADSSALSA
jgi:hypothetical protein